MTSYVWNSMDCVALAGAARVALAGMARAARRMSVGGLIGLGPMTGRGVGARGPGVQKHGSSPFRDSSYLGGLLTIHLTAISACCPITAYTQISAERSYRKPIFACPPNSIIPILFFLPTNSGPTAPRRV
jgi:hypothetical protein